MSYTAVISDSNGLRTTKNYKVKSSFTKHVCPNDISINVLYDEYSSSQFYNEIVSKLMLRNIRGRVILYSDNKNIDRNYICNLHSTITKRQSWASLAKKITEDDAKKMSIDNQIRLDDELKLTEQKLNAVSSMAQYESDSYDDSYEEYDYG